MFTVLRTRFGFNAGRIHDSSPFAVEQQPASNVERLEGVRRQFLRRTPVSIAALLLALFSESAAAAVPTLEECAVLPRRHMRIRVSVTSDLFADVAPVMKQMTEEAWSAEGIAFEWIIGAAVDRDAWAGTDIWIVAQLAPASRHDPAALGAVRFADGRPQPLIRVSLSAATSWVHRYANALMSTRLPLLSALAVGDSRALVRRAVGAAAAHEIGHYVLASRQHAGSGLMQASYDRPDALLGGSRLMLDASSRARLRTRLALRAQCEAVHATRRAP